VIKEPLGHRTSGATIALPPSSVQSMLDMR
jgi:hypothetical protein